MEATPYCFLMILYSLLILGFLAHALFMILSLVFFQWGVHVLIGFVHFSDSLGEYASNNEQNNLKSTWVTGEKALSGLKLTEN